MDNETNLEDNASDFHMTTKEQPPIPRSDKLAPEANVINVNVKVTRSIPLTGKLLERLALPLLWLIICIVFSVLPSTANRFATITTFGSIFGAGAVTLVLTLGLLVPALCGDYDLSVAYTLTLASMLIAVLNVNDHMNIIFAIIIALGVGVLVGIVNAVVSVFFNVDSFIATLGSGTVLAGITLWISNDSTISGVSPGLSRIVIIDTWFGIPLVFYFALILSIIMAVIFSFFPAGRKLRYVGQHREVARLSGVSVRKVRAGSFLISGLLSAAAGVLYTGSAGAADPTSGITLLLPAFAAAFLGATTIAPGQFNPLGSLVAVYFLGTGITGLELLGASSYIQDLFYGGALIIAVILSVTVSKKQISKSA